MTDTGAGSIPECNVNPIDIKTIEQGYDLYEELRKCPVQHSDALGGFYWLTRYGDVRAATLDKRFCSAKKGVLLPPDETAARLFALEQEAPDHMPAKLLYMEPMKAEALKALEPMLLNSVNGLIEEFAQTGECDLMKDFAEPLPVLGVCAAIGVTGVSVDRIRKISSRFGEDFETTQMVIEQLGALVMEELLARQAEPRDDYLSRIANAQLGGRKMDEAELARFMVGFFTAGHETTTSSLGTLLFHALSDPQVRDRMLADDRVLAAAIEEAVRLESPFHGFHRTTTEPVEVDGLTIPADATVRLAYASANHDPKVYERPETFDLDRQGPPHLGFGFGRHVCAGAALARLEMRMAFKLLLSRLPDIRPKTDHIDYKFLGGTLACPRSIPAVFTPSA